MQSIAELLDLSGKGVVVTGGAIGIGQAICLRLAEAGAGVLVVDIDENGARQTAELAVSAGGRAKVMRADARSGADAKKVMKAAVDVFGSLDILVNNAGIYPVSPFMQTPEDLWDRVLELNLKGPFLYSQTAAGQMIDSGHGGKIINMASTDGLKPTGKFVHYNASKGGVIMLTKALALELAPHGIQVNAVAPGGILTPGTMRTQQEMQDITGKSLEEMLMDVGPKFPLGRMGEPDDVSRVVLFLASAAADYITGETIVVDGGYLLA